MMQQSKKYHHGNLKEALLKAGLNILEEQGIAGLSLRNCAQAVGVSHTAPKNHFGCLAGLHTAIATQGYQWLAEYMRKEIPLDSTRPQRRAAALKGYVAFASDHPALYDLMYARERIILDDEALGAAVADCFMILADSAEGWNWTHSSKTDASTRAQMLLWSTVHGYAQLHISGRFKKESMKALSILDIFPDFG